jgi:cellulose 1,4-beta-cellobiosidase
MGQESFYGPGKTIDTTRPFTVITQFLTSDGTDTGDLFEITRFYVQNGGLYHQPSVNVTGIDPIFNTVVDAYCDAEQNAFGGGGNYPYKARGATRQLGEALGRGMVLVFSIWEDSGR